MRAANFHTVALSRLSLAIPQRVGKNEKQLCAAGTTDTFPWFTSPEPEGTRNVSRCQAEGYKMRDQPAGNRMGSEGPNAPVVIVVVVVVILMYF